jgi:hypothetical protein
MQKAKQEAIEILDIYRLMKRDGRLYLEEETEILDQLFMAVIQAIDTSTALKLQLPYQEFVLPSRKVLNKDPGWVRHFKDRDNCRFFLSDVHDYLRLRYGR